MSYQLAMIIHSLGENSINDVFTQNPPRGQETQFGWWIPTRG